MSDDIATAIKLSEEDRRVVEDANRARGASSKVASDPRMTRRVALVSAASIIPVETQYVVPPYVPRGEVTLVDGQTGSGKTMAVVSIIASITVGGTINGVVIPKGRIAILTCEDDPARTIVPRLMAAKADLEAVSFIRVETAVGTDGNAGRKCHPYRRL